MNICKSPAIALCVGTMMVAADGARAAAFFKPAGGAASGYWDDVANWWSNESGTTALDSLPKSTEVLIYAPGVTAIVTNDIPTLAGYARNNALAVGTTTAGSQSMLIIKDHGVVKTVSTDIGGVKSGTGRSGVLVVEAGGSLTSLTGEFSIGKENGFGIITNAGTITASHDITIGVGAGGYGRWVQDGGNARPTSSVTHNIYVGADGQGEIIVKSGVFSGGNYAAGYDSQGIVAIGGTNTVTSRVEVQEGATFKNGFWYVGGYPGHPKGRGEIALRGGAICCGAQMGRRDSLFLGAYRDGAETIDGDCFGAIRGWGVITNIPEVTRYNGIQVLLGNGEIVADGEGFARELDFSQVFQVTNALVGVSGNTSGWRAMRKGVAKMPFSYLFGAGSAVSGAKCVGCSMDGARPDLVNSIRVELTRSGYSGKECYAYAELYAADRDDVHLDELKGEVSVLGAWKVGTFTGTAAEDENKVLSALSAKLSFRYDQTKVQKPGSSIELHKYDSAEGKWTRLTRLEAAQVPADYVLESPAGLANTGETFNLGLFAVVESFHSPTVLSIR